jgi:hypothetical protein
MYIMRLGVAWTLDAPFLGARTFQGLCDLEHLHFLKDVAFKKLVLSSFLLPKCAMTCEILLHTQHACNFCPRARSACMT